MTVRSRDETAKASVTTVMMFEETARRCADPQALFAFIPRAVSMFHANLRLVVEGPVLCGMGVFLHANKLSDTADPYR